MRAGRQATLGRCQNLLLQTDRLYQLFRHTFVGRLGDTGLHLWLQTRNGNRHLVRSTATPLPIDPLRHRPVDRARFPRGTRPSSIEPSFCIASFFKLFTSRYYFPWTSLLLNLCFWMDVRLALRICSAPVFAGQSTLLLFPLSFHNAQTCLHDTPSFQRCPRLVLMGICATKF